MSFKEKCPHAEEGGCPFANKEKGEGCPYAKEKGEGCPYKEDCPHANKEGKEGCPFAKKEGEEGCPFAKAEESGCPYAKEGEEGCPFAKEGSGCPYAKEGSGCPYSKDHGLRAKKEYTLYYFDMKGRAELTRNLFKIAKVEFQDIRLDSTKFEEMKEQGLFAYGQVPALKIKKGDKETIIPQSRAIERYLARKFKLDGKTSMDKLLVDAVVEGVVDTRLRLSQTVYIATEAEKASFVEQTYPKFLAGFEKLIKGPFVLGNEFSYADLAIHDLVVNARDRGFASFDVSKYSPKTAALVDSVEVILTLE